ncbi:MAG TPA: hypothetical protein PKW51_07970, partial [Methanoregulaceae archaeon]|nr:hypothetical protein [Methanoregulaceae archaeon]
EGAGAAPLALLLSGKVEVKPGEQVAVVISGGNVDPVLFERVLRKGLFESGRMLDCVLELEEGPRSLPALLTLIAGEGGTISRVEQERGSPDLALHLIRVNLGIETRGPAHQDRILARLESAGYRVTTPNRATGRRRRNQYT